MADANDALKSAHGFTNGKAKHSGKQVAKSNRPSSKKQRSFFAWLLNNTAWLSTWFVILTVLFRCPPTIESCDETSPFICQYYYQTKDIVVPHVKPYYDEYAGPYVDIVQPYYTTLNDKILIPTQKYAVQYGTPLVNKAHEYGLAQWEKNGEAKLQEFQALAKQHYDEKLGPYVVQTSEALGPYVEAARTEALQLFYGYLLPGYNFVQPYAADTYQVASKFTADTAIPSASWAWGKTYTFLDTAIWPHIRVLYVENVEPQLVRIGERLARYKTKVRSKGDMAAGFENLTKNQRSSGSTSELDRTNSPTASSFSKPMTQSTTKDANAAESTAKVSSTDASAEYAQPVQAPPPGENESDKRRKAREMVSQDLEMWQNRFATLADEGANDMEERVDEIAKRMIAKHVQGTGKGLVDELEATVEAEIKALKGRINGLVEISKDITGDPLNEALKAVRAAGASIKEQAQAVREWRRDYDTELHNIVVQAADAHFQLLDETRGLALQQIGMKWAWTDGVTYKDWAKYHELKSTFSEWTEQLKQLIISQPTLLEAQDASAQVEDESMEIASNAAKELGRLKEVAHWKLVAEDTTDNFELEDLKLVAESKAAAADEARLAAIRIAEEALKREQQAAEEANLAELEAARKAAEQVADHEQVASEREDISLDSTGDASSPVDTLPASSDIEDELVEEQAQADSTAVDENSEKTGTTPDSETDVSADGDDDDSSVSSETLSASAHESDEAENQTSTEVLASKPSEDIISGTGHIVANLSDDDSEVLEDDKTEDDLDRHEDARKPYAEAPVKRAAFGAMAQAVSDRQPILDDVDEEEEANFVASVTDAAEEAYSKAVSAAADQYSSAVSIVSAQIYGTPKPVHDELLSSFSSAYDNAVAAASSRFNDMTAAAKGTPTQAPKPTSLVDWHKVEAIAAQRLNEGRLWAEIQYQSAVIALGLATPTPTSRSEKFYEQAKLNYYAGIGLAQDRYSSFIAAASSAMSSLTATPTPTDFAGTVSSIASKATESAASAYQAAEEAYSAASDNVASAVQAVDDSIVSAFDAASEQVYLTGAAIAETWDKVLLTLEGQIYGEQKQIGWYENLFREASSSASAVTDKAAAGASTASAQAAKQYSAVTEIVSELLVDKEPTFQQSVLSRLSAAYATATSNIGSAASQATDAIKGKVQHDKDEL